MRGSDAIYDLLGASSEGAREPAPHLQDETPATGSDDIIRHLNDQYYQAINSFRVSLAGEWVGSGLPIESRSTWQSWEDMTVGHGATGSISDLLSDIERLEEAFGPLRHGESLDPVVSEVVPEILQLFAPPEFHTTALHRSTLLPPPLARREHHALAIDSPMVVRDAAFLADSEAM